jgi:hypothetical protein
MGMVVGSGACQDRAMRRICVFAGSSPGARADYGAAARDLGHALVERGLSLVYGGAHVGTMGVLADAVLERGGRVIGVLPAGLAAKEIAHPGLTELRIVGSMHERKSQMAELADGFVALPGGFGTLEELLEILTWGQLGLHRKPCAVLNVAGYFGPLLSFLDHAVAERFVATAHRAMLLVDDEPRRLLERIRAYQPPSVEKWLDRATT